MRRVFPDRQNVPQKRLVPSLRLNAAPVLSLAVFVKAVHASIQYRKDGFYGDSRRAGLVFVVFRALYLAILCFSKSTFGALPAIF